MAFESFTYEHAAALRHLLEPVRHAGEACAARRDRVRVDTRAPARPRPPPSRSRGCERRAGASRSRRSGARRSTRARRRARQVGVRAAEAHVRARRLTANPMRRQVVLGLVREDAQLGVAVGLEACRGGRGGPRVTFSSSAHVGRERRRVLELEARRLADHRRAPGRCSPTSDASGVPTLPATATGTPACASDRAEQLDRGGLAVGAGDRDERGSAAAARPARARRAPAGRARAPRRSRAPRSARPGSSPRSPRALEQVEPVARRGAPRAVARGTVGLGRSRRRSPRRASRSMRAAATPERASPTTRYGPREGAAAAGLT